MKSEAQAQPRWTLSLFMVVLATSIPFVVSGVDPLLLSLNLPAITQDLGIPSDLVGFTGSVATLVMAAAVLGVGNLGDLYGYKRLLIYGLIGNIVFQVLTTFSPSHQFLIRHAGPRRPRPDGPARAVAGAPDGRNAGCDPSDRHRPVFSRIPDLHRHHAADQRRDGR